MPPPESNRDDRSLRRSGSVSTTRSDDHVYDRPSTSSSSDEFRRGLLGEKSDEKGRRRSGPNVGWTDDGRRVLRKSDRSQERAARQREREQERALAPPREGLRDRLIDWMIRLLEDLRFGRQRSPEPGNGQLREPGYGPPAPAVGPHQEQRHAGTLGGADRPSSFRALFNRFVDWLIKKLTENRSDRPQDPHGYGHDRSMAPDPYQQQPYPPGPGWQGYQPGTTGQDPHPGALRSQEELGRRNGVSELAPVASGALSVPDGPTETERRFQPRGGGGGNPFVASELDASPPSEAEWRKDFHRGMVAGLPPGHQPGTSGVGPTTEMQQVPPPQILLRTSTEEGLGVEALSETNPFRRRNWQAPVEPQPGSEVEYVPTPLSTRPSSPVSEQGGTDQHRTALMAQARSTGFGNLPTSPVPEVSPIMGSATPALALPVAAKTALRKGK